MNRFNKIHEMFAKHGFIGARMHATNTLYISMQDLENNRELYESKYLVTRVKGRWYVGGFPVPEKDVSLFYNQGLDLVNIGAAKLWLKNHEDEVRLELFFRDKKLVAPRTQKHRLVVRKVLSAWAEYLADRTLLKSEIGMTHEEIHEYNREYIHCKLLGFSKHSWEGFYPKSTDKEAQYLLSTNNCGIGVFPPSHDWSELDIHNPHIKF